MGRDLSNLNIKDSYEGLVQISGSQLTDGTGSLINNIEATASYATTASFAENVTTPTLQSVTDEGATTTNTITISGSDECQIHIYRENSAGAGISFEDNTTTDNEQVGVGALGDELCLRGGGSVDTKVNASGLRSSNITASGDIHADEYKPSGSTTTYYTNDALDAGLTRETLLLNQGTGTSTSIWNGGSQTIQFRTNDTETRFVNYDVNIVTGLTATSITSSNYSGDGSGIVGLKGGDAPNSLASANFTTTDAKAEGSGSIAIGDNASVTGSTSENTIVIGKDADSKENSTRNVIIGDSATMSEGNRNDSVVIGANATAYQESVVVGADTNGLFASVAVGRYAYNNDNYGIAVGYGARTNNNGGIAIGSGSLQDGDGSIAIGKGAHATATGDVVINNSYGDVYTYDSSSNTTTLEGVLAIDGIADVSASIAGAGGDSFPFTGSAEITGSLDVTGSIKSIGGVAIGSETFPTSLTTSGNVVIGGSGNGNSNNGPRITAGGAHVVLGGYNSTISSTGLWDSIVGGSGNQITAGTANSVIGGYYNTISSGEWGSILGAKDSTLSVSGANPRVIVGGDGNSLSGGADNAIIAGVSNTLTHDRSVVIGGQSLSSTKADEVSVPNLTINGDTEIISGSLSGSLIDNIVPTGSITQTQIQHIVSLDEDDYDALTPSDDTLYLLGDSSGSIVDGYLRGGVEALTISSATASMDCKLGNFFTLTLSGSVHLEASNIQAGQTINLRLTQPATPATLTFSNDFEFEGGNAPDVTNIGSSTDIMSFVTFDGTTLYGNMINNFS